MDNLILYAPNVHTGGGYVLLNALLLACPNGVKLRAFLDERAREHLAVPDGSEVFWVNATVRSRFKAEAKLKSICGSTDTVFCFHGLPPVLPNPGRVVVFQQNRNYLGLNSLRDFPLRTALRLGYERFVSRVFRHRVAEYIVQTPTMERDLLRWYNLFGKSAAPPVIRVLPFVDRIANDKPEVAADPEWDFVYVADGVAHKNHQRLLDAWSELGRQGLRPKLALTLGERDANVIAKVNVLRAEENLEIYNLGHMPHQKVLELYNHARGLIFPSLSESFGLPLIEATACGLPIVASELDFIRDVCQPVQTFDPTSSISIARAVKRFLDVPDPTIKLDTPSNFWDALLDDN